MGFLPAWIEERLPDPDSAAWQSSATCRFNALSLLLALDL